MKDLCKVSKYQLKFLKMLLIKLIIQENFSEFGFICTKCNLDICLICVHRCHIGHDVISKGYSKFDCKCYFYENSNSDNFINSPNLQNKCNATKILEVPSHIKSFNLNEITNVLYPSEIECQSYIKVDLIYFYRILNLSSIYLHKQILIHQFQKHQSAKLIRII